MNHVCVTMLCVSVAFTCSSCEHGDRSGSSDVVSGNMERHRLAPPETGPLDPDVDWRVREVRLIPTDRSEQFRVVHSNRKSEESHLLFRELIQLELLHDGRWTLVHEYLRVFNPGPADYARPVLLIGHDSGILCYSDGGGRVDFQLVHFVEIEEKPAKEWHRKLREQFEAYERLRKDNRTESHESTAKVELDEDGRWPSHRLQTDGIRQVREKCSGYTFSDYLSTSHVIEAVLQDDQLTSVEICVQFCKSQSADVESTYGIVMYTRDHEGRWSIANVRISDVPRETGAAKSQ